MYRKRDGVPVFSKTTYCCRNPVRKIEYFFNDIKYCYQRIKYGWCDKDTWNIDMWFLAIIPPMLQHLRDNKHGYPEGMEEDEWNNILETMIAVFTKADNKVNEELTPEEADEYKNKGFEFFSKYFWNLWD